LTEKTVIALGYTKLPLRVDKRPFHWRKNSIRSASFSTSANGLDCRRQVDSSLMWVAAAKAGSIARPRISSH